MSSNLNECKPLESGTGSREQSATVASPSLVQTRQHEFVISRQGVYSQRALDRRCIDERSPCIYVKIHLEGKVMFRYRFESLFSATPLA